VPTTARTFLFVPADHQRRLDAAWEQPADAVIADLEDSVAPGAKDAARETLARRLSAGPPRGILCVRVNALGGPEAEADLALLERSAGVAAVVVPKASAAGIDAAAIRTPVIALVETASGLLEAPRIAATPGVVRLMLGSVDLSAELGAELAGEAPLLQHARATLALASAAAGLPAPIDGVWARIDDEAGLRAETRAARAAGLSAKACIHPRQLARVEEELSPRPEELEQARRVVKAAGAAFADGEGAIVLDGRMIDRPVLVRAQRLLERAGRGSA
jgi:citrate lyase beta subunit